jgi:branched-chain amino acid transport system ATP-binding protein
MLQIHNLSKNFDGVQAVREVSLSIQPGKITSLIGPNGAGKTTLFNIVTGFLNPDNGRATFKSNHLLGLPPWRIAQLGIARTFQNLRLFRKLTVQENVLLGIGKQRGEGFLHALVRFSKQSSEHRQNLESADELLGFVGLSSHRTQLADNLSYGQQKLLSIACCLAGDPELLLLDEPVAGVQPEMIRKIEGLIKELVERQGKTVFLIEHDIDFVLRVSDSVIVMDEGKKIVEDKPDAIGSNSAILEAYLT